MWGIRDIVVNITIFDIIDISIVAYIFYKAYFLVKETRAEQLIKGIVILILAMKVSELMQFQVVHFILQKTMTVGIIALLIVFQPELRRGLEQIGRTKFFLKNAYSLNKKDSNKMISELNAAVSILSIRKIGALIVLENETGIGEIASTGTLIDGAISKQLLINIFEPNTPLHDGAVVIRNNRVLAAGCFLPLTENNDLNQEVGTRHRAALGISEKSDAIAIIVSEETGNISIAESGKLITQIGRDVFANKLRKTLSRKTAENLDENEVNEDV